MLRPLLPVLLVVCLALAPALRAADDWPVARGPSREPVPHRHDPRILPKIPRAFLDDSVATILYAGSNYLVEADGTIEIVTHEITRLNGRKGIEKLGEFRGISYTPAYQKLTLNEARIHKANGTVVPIEPRHVHLRDVSTDYQVYDTDKQLIISFPGLEVGDVFEVKWTIRGKNPEHAGRFFTRYSFGDPQYPVVLDELRIRVPRETPLKQASVNEKLTPVVSEADGKRLYYWKAANRPRTPRDENLPSREELRPVVVVSTFTSWEEVGRWKQKIRENCWKCTPEIGKVVERVTRDLKSPHDKARALTYWVRRNVRYVSAGEKHDYTPHLPEKVLANRFGDCKDTSQLLAVMLREVGIPVELATLGAQDDGQILPDVPSPWGTHAILLATIDGKKHWIDTTTPLSGWDFLPRDDLDRLCYLTDEKGKIRLERTPAPTPERNRIEQFTDVWLAHDGTSRCRRTVTSHGSAAVSARDSYVEVPPGERRRQLVNELQDANSRTRLLRVEVDEKALADFDRPVVVKMEFEIPRHFTGSAEKEGSITDSKVWSRLLAYNIDHDRKTPLVLSSPFESIHTYRLHVPAACGLESVPRERTLKAAWGSFTIRARALDDGDTIRNVEVVFHTRIDVPRVEVADLEAFRKFHDEVNREYRVWLVMKPVTDVATASYLEEVLQVAPQDVFTGRTLAKIYLKAERLADARRVLDRACSYAPDEADLWELRVQASETPAEEEKALREVVKRYPKDLKHARELGRVLISQGKQAEARGLLEPLTRLGASDEKALAHYQLARSHYRKDELKEALAELDRAEKADAAAVDLLRFHVLRGQVLDELKRPAEAIRAYQNALKLEKTNQEVLLSLVRLHLVNKDELAALDLLRQYVMVVGKDVSGLVLAAETYYKMKRHDEAFELAMRARDHAFHEKAQRILGLVYLARGDHARARQHLEKADADAVVLAGLLRATTALGRVRDLETLLDRAGRLDRPSPALLRQSERARSILRRRATLGRLVKAPPGKEEALAQALDALVCAEQLDREGRPAGEVETLLAAALKPGLAIGPLSALRGKRALEQGKLRLAHDEAARAIERCPNDPAGYHLRGRVRLERGSNDALPDLEKAALLTTRQDPAVLSSLAAALAAADRLDEAVQTARAAVKLRPDDRDLADQLRGLEETARKKRAG